MASYGETVTDRKTNIQYLRGRFLGKGGFAKCYEFTDMNSGKIFAGKVVAKSTLVKPQHKVKMSQEISIHKTLNHPYVVKFFSHFEDEINIYIMLELCTKRTLMEMHKRRKALTSTEVRYFMKQICLACRYLHGRKIIHRDLKLGNLFINDNMEIKVGDFGLATILEYDGERKKTLCGTPNYIAPEILAKAGHSYEVDIWSLGCIMYTLLVGTPPFETSSLKDTYTKIRKNDYNLPVDMCSEAKKLIRRMLHPEAKCRPSPEEILADDFFKDKLIPNKLPTSCLTMAPRQSHSTSNLHTNGSSRRPLSENNKLAPVLERQVKKTEPPKIAKENVNIPEIKPTGTPTDCYLSQVVSQMTATLNTRPATRFTGQDEDAQDPSLVPFVWISKWIDYVDKYGLGFSLCDDSKGVAFTDGTHILRLSDEVTIQYIDKMDIETYFQASSFPQELHKKMKLLEYFITYMTENLCKAGESVEQRVADEFAQVPHIHTWHRTNSAILFHLTNGTIQLNIFKDHTKLIVCPIMGAVSYIDEKKNFTTYKLASIEKYGCSKGLYDRLAYMMNMIERYLLNPLKEKKQKV